MLSQQDTDDKTVCFPSTQHSKDSPCKQEASLQACWLPPLEKEGGAGYKIYCGKAKERRTARKGKDNSGLKNKELLNEETGRNRKKTASEARQKSKLRMNDNEWYIAQQIIGSTDAPRKTKNKKKSFQLTAILSHLCHFCRLADAATLSWLAGWLAGLLLLLQLHDIDAMICHASAYWKKPLLLL